MYLCVSAIIKTNIIKWKRCSSNNQKGDYDGKNDRN